MIPFGLYTGQRLGDVATLRWSNVDLVKGEIRLRTRKTDKVMILPIAAPLRRYLEGLPSSDDVNKSLHPRAFAVVARQGKSGALSRHFIELLGQAGIREKQAHRSRGIGRSVQRQAGALSFHSLRRTAMGPSRPWSDRYLFFPFNYLQRLLTREVLTTLKGIEPLSPVIFRTSLEGRSTRSVGRESFGVKRSVRVQAFTCSR
jgi:integrase